MKCISITLVCVKSRQIKIILFINILFCLMVTNYSLTRSPCRNSKNMLTICVLSEREIMFWK